MKKSFKKKPTKPKQEKPDSKQDLIYAGYLIEDITSYEALLPKGENDSIPSEKVDEILEMVKKIKVRSESFSTAFRAKYDSVRFNKIQSISKAFLRNGKDNPRFRYAFLLKEYTASRKELYKYL